MFNRLSLSCSLLVRGFGVEGALTNQELGVHFSGYGVTWNL